MNGGIDPLAENYVSSLTVAGLGSKLSGNTFDPIAEFLCLLVNLAVEPCVLLTKSLESLGNGTLELSELRRKGVELIPQSRKVASDIFNPSTKSGVEVVDPLVDCLVGILKIGLGSQKFSLGSMGLGSLNEIVEGNLKTSHLLLQSSNRFLVRQLFDLCIDVVDVGLVICTTRCEADYSCEE